MWAAAAVRFSFTGVGYQPCAVVATPTAVSVAPIGVFIEPQALFVAPFGVNAQPFGVNISPTAIVIAPYDTTVAGQVCESLLSTPTMTVLVAPEPMKPSKTVIQDSLQSDMGVNDWHIWCSNVWWESLHEKRVHAATPCPCLQVAHAGARLGMHVVVLHAHAVQWCEYAHACEH